jgi:hypothetical protein
MTRPTFFHAKRARTNFLVDVSAKPTVGGALAPGGIRPKNDDLTRLQTGVV